MQFMLLLSECNLGHPSLTPNGWRILLLHLNLQACPQWGTVNACRIEIQVLLGWL